MNGQSRAWAVVALGALGALCAGCPGYPALEQERVIEGSYDAETRYDMQTLSGALSGSVRAWESPELVIRDKILERFRGKYGERIYQTVNSLYGGRIEEQILRYVRDFAPDWLLDLPSKLEVVDAQVRMVDVQMSVLLAEQADGSVKATQIWNGISVFRDPGCREAGGLACDQISITTEELLDAEYPIEIASTTYTGQVQGDSLAMRSHEVRFNYGRLALYLMTNLALPDEPGAGLQLRDVVLAAINCRGMAGRLTGDDGVLGWQIAGVEVGISLNDVIGSCEDGVFAMINGFIDQFNVPLRMDLTGAMTLMDNDRDGRIDQLVTQDLEGDLDATLVSGRSHEGPVSGQMTGWRVGELPARGDDLDSEGTDIDDGVPIYDAEGQ